ncbi:hypothetical protein [Citrobacter amalonaticus]|uniref:hypothetical protein n=1 Tax=Citrobacter amalonaticus TaxID=35703 RepID=UPI00300D74D1
MTHTFFEFPQLFTDGHGVYDVDSLVAVLEKKEETAHAFSGTAVLFVKAIFKLESAPQLKNCRFAFVDQDNYQCFEVDGKGKIKKLDDIPDWFVNPSEFARSQWLVNRDLDSERVTKLIAYILDHNIEDRRSYCDLLFNLELGKMKPSSASPATGKPGNKNGKSTKPRVTDLNSFELFSQFFDRLKIAVNADEFPTLQFLTNEQDVNKAPNTLKQGIRTWFKAVTGEQIPNNKKIQAGAAGLFCAPIREQVTEIESVGLEKYYKALSQAIAEAGEESYISDFTFRFPAH